MASSKRVSNRTNIDGVINVTIQHNTTLSPGSLQLSDDFERAGARAWSPCRRGWQL